MGNQCTKETASAIEQESMPSAKARNFRESVLDITGKPVNMSQTAADGGPTGVPRLKNIFAAPVKIDADYVFPVYEKSEEDLKFVESVAKENFIFSGVEATELVNLLNAFESYTAVKGDKIITEGETGDYFYILQKGKVRFTVDGATVGEASDGASFGDLALLYNCPRAASCTADSSCQLWRVEQGAFRQILANSTLNKDKAVLDTLKKVSFLQDLDIEYLHKMANAVETKTFSKGSQLIKKGDQGLEFFVLKSGKVTVSDIEVGGKKFDDQILESGAYFGERAIVKEEPRAANVYATTAVTTLVLSRKQFLEILGPLEDLMTKTNTLRSLKGIPAFARSDVKEAEYKTLASRIVYKTFSKGEILFTDGDDDGSGIYFVNSGKVSCDGNEITMGGFIGLVDTVLPKLNTATAMVVEPGEIGYLSKAAIVSSIVQISRVQEGSKKQPLRQDSVVTVAVPLKNLTKHRILGVGTFGKVWLVTNGNSKEAYALKVQRKRNLLDHAQVEGVLREMNVMARLNHPFVLKLVNVYEDADAVLMLVRLVQGGELYGVMQKARRNILQERSAKFYSAGILEGLTYMHSYNILYRDLKPENVLINADGYPVIVDLGFAKEVPDKSFTLCGTPWYIAPEVILGRGHDNACDHWSWAILVHEMVSGETPFQGAGSDQMTLFKAIVRGNYKISKHCSAVQTDLIKRILVTKPSKRLGSLAGEAMDIQTHDWLADVNFDKLRQKKFKAPWKPPVKDAIDVSGYDNWDHMEKDEKLKPLSAKEQKEFAEVHNISDTLLSR